MNLHGLHIASWDSGERSHGKCGHPNHIKRTLSPVTFTLATAEVARGVFRRKIRLTESQIRATVRNSEGYPVELLTLIVSGAAEAMDAAIQRTLAGYWRAIDSICRGAQWRWCRSTQCSLVKRPAIVWRALIWPCVSR